MFLKPWDTTVYPLLFVCASAYSQTQYCMFLMSWDTTAYPLLFVGTSAYSQTQYCMFLMSRDTTVYPLLFVCTSAYLFPDTICFLCPETQQYIHYSLYAQVLISRHNMFLMSWAVALLQYLLFFVWGAIPRHKGIKCTRFVVGSGWSLWPKGIESYVIFSSMDDCFC